MIHLFLNFQYKRKMKNINTYSLRWLLAFALITACDDGFDEMNTNPVRLTSVDPAFQLNYTIIESAPVYGNLTYETTIVRQMITPFTGVGTGGNLNQDNRSATQDNWQRYFRNIVKNVTDVVERTKDDPENANLYHMARIWRAHAFMVLTDTYGDIPYTEAGLAYLGEIVFPAYDSQEAVYTDILNELETAAAALDAAKPIASQDILYKGDVTRWKRLGNSLLLRAAMRLTKVNPGLAQQYVDKAVAGGLMQSNDDNAVIRHDANYRNPLGTQLNGGQAPFYYLDQEFVNFLKSNNDPRLAAIAVRYVGALSGNDQVEENAVRTADVQVGMPQGYDNTTIPPVAEAAGLASLFDYSQLDRKRLGDPEAPSFLVTYAQTQLLLAEAIVRGWAQGDANSLYPASIVAHMEQLAAYGDDSNIPDSLVDVYIQTHPLAVGKELEQINNQYWVASFLNGPEAFANFRRSGYPVVAPNPYPGSDLKTEDFIRRLTYPDSELTVNKEHVDVAISRQGPDDLDTRIWWDVE